MTPKLVVLLLLTLCISQIFCAAVSNANENVMDEDDFGDDEEEVSVPTVETTEEIVTTRPVPTVRMPPSSDMKSESRFTKSKPFSQNKEYYVGQIEMWPPKMNHPEFEILEAKAYCHETDLTLFLQFGSPFNGFVYPYHHFKRCNLFTGSGETEVHLVTEKNSCGTDVMVLDSPKGNISFLEFTLMIQWHKEYMGAFDRKVRITCNQQDNNRKHIELNNTHSLVWMEIETESEDEDSEDTTVPAYDVVRIGETVDVVLNVDSHSDGDDKFDAQVVKCVAHDGLQADKQSIGTYGVGENSKFPYDGTKVLLADGCPENTAIFSTFEKTAKGKTVILSNSFKMFRFPSSSFVFLACDVRICRDQCPPQQECDSKLKTELSPSEDHKLIHLFRPLLVKIGPAGGMTSMDEHDVGKSAVSKGLPTASFIAGLIGMGFVCAIVCVFMYRRFNKGTEKDYKMQYNSNADKSKDEVAPLKVTSTAAAE